MGRLMSHPLTRGASNSKVVNSSWKVGHSVLFLLLAQTKDGGGGLRKPRLLTVFPFRFLQSRVTI